MTMTAEPLRVLIVDDEPLARSRLRALLGQCRDPAALAAGEAASAAQALALARQQPFDLALLDIHMPGIDGLQLAQALRDLPHPPPVVFVTAHAEHAVQAFDIDAADYLTKPVRLQRLEAALQKIERLKTMQPAHDGEPEGDWLLIPERNRTLRVPLADVLCLRADLKYISVRTTAGATHLLEGSLNQLEEKYPARLLRIHRNALVSRQAIRALVRHRDPQEGDCWAVRLEGMTEPLPVSRRQTAAVREALGHVGR
jgi:two-component system response regulator AlgR